MSFRYFLLSTIFLAILIHDARSKQCITVPWDSLTQVSYSEIFLGRLDHKNDVNNEIHYTFEVLHKWKGSTARSITVIGVPYPLHFIVDRIYLITADLKRYKGNQRMNRTFLETSGCAHNLSITDVRFSSAVIILNRLFPEKVKLSDIDQRSIYRYSLLSLVFLGLSIHFIRRFG